MGIVTDSVRGVIIQSALPGLVYRSANTDIIVVKIGAEQFNFPFSLITTIGGVARPATIAETIPLIAQMWPNSGTEYKGVWNATTNVPALANGAGTPGDFYHVSVAGSHNFGSGAVAFVIGDTVYYNGTIWEKVPTSALQTVGGTLTGPLKIIQNVTGKKLIIAMLDPGTQADAPNAIGAISEYISLGMGEWGSGTYRGMGYGYKAAEGNHSPVWIGYEEISTTSNTRGKFIVATRPNNNNEAPQIRLIVDDQGQIIVGNASYVPGSDLALVDRKYSDRGRVGATAARPTLLLADEGFQYYDSTLKKPLWWNGTAWTDATGTAV